MAAMEEALLKRVLPHSVEAEQSVIGSHDDRQEAIVEASGFYGKRTLRKTVWHRLCIYGGAE